MARNVFYQASPLDNVVTALLDIPTGQTVTVNELSFATLESIPFGYKFALCDIKQGDAVIKYGEQIGLASMQISTGSVVHVHNLESCRGRGDIPDSGARS